MAEGKILWLALNAKYTHTSLTVRYLREACRGRFDTEILELTINNLLPEILGEIYERQPRVLGIACYIWNISLVRGLLRLLPEVLPDTVLLCGGPEVSYETGRFMREFPMVDCVIRGEGEEAVPALLAALACGGSRDIPGVAWRDADGGIHEGTAVTVADLRSLPFAYAAGELAELSERILYYETSRGCPFSCAYCLSCATRGVRYVPLERVLHELAGFARQNVRQVKLVDRTFNASKAHFLPILRFLLALPAECRTNFHFEVAIDYLDEEVLTVLGQLPPGRIQLEIGIQSTNPRTLARVSRVNHWEKIAAHIRRILGFHNMHLHADLIIGLPEEDRASFARSFNDVYALQADMLQLGFLKFLKGAAMMALVDEGGYHYMPLAPYEVLSNRWLSYADIRWFHSFEQVFGYTYNAGRCRRTIDWLLRTREAGDAFRFYARLTDWWEARGYHRVGHSARQLYSELRDFAAEGYGIDGEQLDNLLRYDALLADAGRIRPEELEWNRQQYQPLTAAFWRGAAVRQCLPDFVFTNWRDIRSCYHIELFRYDVQQTGAAVLPERLTALLFDYTGRTVRVQPLVLRDGALAAGRDK